MTYDFSCCFNDFYAARLVWFPVRVPVFVMRLAELKAKPDANHANTHPINDWSCQICNQHRATSPARGSGFKSDTTRTNLARTGIPSFVFIMPAILPSKSKKVFSEIITPLPPLFSFGFLITRHPQKSSFCIKNGK
jgi:hypothetical protein